MAITPRDFPRLYFRKVIRDEMGQVAMDADMMRLLMVIHEDKNLSRIIKETGMKLANLESALTRLMNVGLVEKIEKSVSCLNGGFMEELETNLKISIGPVADLLIEDVLDDMGLSEHEVPTYLGAELIHNLARQIPREEKRIQFQKAMLARIPK